MLTSLLKTGRAAAAAAAATHSYVTRSTPAAATIGKMQSSAAIRSVRLAPPSLAFTAAQSTHNIPSSSAASPSKSHAAASARPRRLTLGSRHSAKFPLSPIFPVDAPTTRSIVASLSTSSNSNDAPASSNTAAASATTTTSPGGSIADRTVSKKELADRLAKSLNFSRKDALNIVNTFLEEVTEAVAAGERVSLIGFGTFEARERKAREGRNPRTGEALKIPATRVPAFSAGTAFKQKVNGAASSDSTVDNTVVDK